MAQIPPIRYDILAQDALRGLVRKVLSDAARFGLPGDHHFFVSFDTRAPGVRLSNRLRERHPEEMTIVLQHQFWDLNVTEHAFEVGLSFGNAPERLLVPFTAVKGFFDPSVQFLLQFDVAVEEEEDDSADDAESVSGPSPQRRPPPGAKSEPVETPPSARSKSLSNIKKPGEGAEKDKDDKAGAQVVSLDAFRKK